MLSSFIPPLTLTKAVMHVKVILSQRYLDIIFISWKRRSYTEIVLIMHVHVRINSIMKSKTNTSPIG